MIVPSLVWHTFGAYNVAFIITYIDVGFALLFRYQGNAKASIRGTTTVEFHVFFVPFCEDFEVIFEVDFVAFFSKIGRIIMILDGLVKC